MIYIYKNNVITHAGQTTVEGFGKEIMAMKDEIKSIENLIVYAGYHGDESGEWVRDFDKGELEDTERIAQQFVNAQLQLVFSPGLTDDEIKQAVKRGNVFFTWCDSDAKVQSVVGQPEPV